MRKVPPRGPCLQEARSLYWTHETRENAAVSLTDLETGETRLLAQRSDWERFDGLEWTPWGTLLAGEEVRAGRTCLRWSRCLFISEDPGGRPKRMDNDVWAALPPTSDERYEMASETVRFASLSDCGAEPSGIYFRAGSRTLYLNIMHRGGSGPNDLFLPDLSLAVVRER